jgi:hypothetical protein
LPDKSTLPLLLQSVVNATEGTLVLVLDQFELLFEPSINPEARDSFIDELMQSLREISPFARPVFRIEILWDSITEVPNKWKSLATCFH